MRWQKKFVTLALKQGAFYRMIPFGFRLVDPADVDLAVREVERAGGTVLSRGELCPGEPYAFVAAPGGYEVEIWFEPGKSS